MVSLLLFTRQTTIKKGTLKILNYSSDASGIHLVSSFWYLDSPYADGPLSANKHNKVYTSRLLFLNNCQAIELYGRLHAYLYISDRMLLSGVDMNIVMNDKLHRVGRSQN
jgi:hypothetical protein